MQLNPTSPNEGVFYPKIPRRIRAVIVDGVITPFFALGTLLVTRSFGLEKDFAILAAVMMIFMLEPVLVSLTGGTIGHHLNGLKIKNVNTGRNINLLASSVRYIIKVVLGLYSLVLILITKRHQAVHDAFSRSVVILKNPSSLPSYEVLGERIVEESAYIYPTVGRRIAMIIFYTVSLFVFVSFLSGVFLLSDQCVYSNLCSVQDDRVTALLGLVWFIGFLTLIVLCWRGMMPGCRRVAVESLA